VLGEAQVVRRPANRSRPVKVSSTDELGWYLVEKSTSSTPRLAVVGSASLSR
jgi:hypothetical protein